MSPEPVYGSPENWIRHAKSDQELALVNPIPPGVLFETLCFHAQQAVEKSIKAVLLLHQVEFPYTHDLAKLITLLKENLISWPDALDLAAELTLYAVNSRYPGDSQPVSQEEYREAIFVSAQVLQWAAGFISASSQGLSRVMK